MDTSPKYTVECLWVHVRSRLPLLCANWLNWTVRSRCCCGLDLQKMILGCAYTWDTKPSE